MSDVTSISWFLRFNKDAFRRIVLVTQDFTTMNCYSEKKCVVIILLWIFLHFNSFLLMCGDYLTLNFFAFQSVSTNYSKDNQQKGQSTPDPPKSAAGKKLKQWNITLAQMIEGILVGQNPKGNGFVSSSLPSSFRKHENRPTCWPIFNGRKHT